jgi:GT2 family glycosyltransferase/glycosyltransferase involved in cell wall biosynthesis
MLCAAADVRDGGTSETGNVPSILTRLKRLAGRAPREPEPLALIRAAPEFDADFYLAANPDVRAARADPARHFLEHGWRELRNPSPAFDVVHYLRRYPDVAAAGLNPLVHYLTVGKAEGREPRNVARRPIERPVRPPETAWAGLAPRRDGDVVVIVPVYRGLDDTLACLHSVLAAKVATPFRLVVVDDATPEPALAAALDGLAGRGLFTLLRNPANRGFVASANRGIAEAGRGDVVLLNADTLVYDGWLDRLLAHFSRDAAAGTVTPLSSNATIASYPVINRDNGNALELSFAELDGLAATANAGLSVEAPTGVGFCMAIRRAVLDRVGPLDEAAFGRGYGEENDLCRRAAAAGFGNLIAGDVYVLHTGEVSFAADAGGERRRGAAALAERHPGYFALVEDYIRRDPVRPLRARLDLARLVRATEGRPTVLFVTHDLGGGIETNARSLADGLAADGYAVVFLRSQGRSGLALLELHGAPLDLPNLVSLDLAAMLAAVEGLLAALPVALAHVHSLHGLDPEAGRRIVATLAAHGVGYDVTIHDYAAICPRLNLVGAAGRYCGEPEEAVCRACLVDHAPTFPEIDIAEWRAGWAALLAGARRVVAPSADAAARIARRFGRAPDVLPHPEAAPTPIAAAPRGVRRERVVAVIGGLSLVKGLAVVDACAREAARSGRPLAFLVVGAAADARLDGLGNVTATGRYGTDEQALAALAEHAPDVAFFPSVWPETYAYTLSLALRAGLPPVAFDIGAPAERIRRLGCGLVLPFERLDDPAFVNRALAAVAPGAPPPEAIAGAFAAYPSVARDYYALGPV